MAVSTPDPKPRRRLEPRNWPTTGLRTRVWRPLGTTQFLRIWRVPPAPFVQRRYGCAAIKPSHGGRCQSRHKRHRPPARAVACRENRGTLPSRDRSNAWP